MNTIRCSCGTPLKIKPEMAGKQVRCPNCKQVLPVPADAASETIGASSDTSLAAADPPAGNRPRLRSEALRAATPVTSMEAVASSSIPMVKTVAAIVAPVTAASIPTTPPPVPPAPPDIQQRQPRVVPPLPPPAIADLDPLPDLAPLDPLAPSAWSGGPLASSALAPSPRLPMQPPAAAQAAAVESGSKSLALWIGGGATVLVLLIVAFLVGRGGSSKPPNENLATESAPSQRIEEPAPEPTPVAAVTPPIERPLVAPTIEEPAPPPSQTPDPPVENPAEAVKPVARLPAPAPPPPRGADGLTGVSRQYDDLHCMRIQAQHSVRVPAAATILEVDGQRLPISNLGVLAESPAPYLYLPRGTHAVKFRKNETPVEVTIQSDLSQVYHEMRQFFDAGGNVREAELLSRGAKAMDVHSAPFLLNLMAGAHLGKQQPQPAERKVRRSLRVNPLFAPAHLNLAALLAKRGATAEARQELELADATNVGNCFGLSPTIYELRRQWKLPPAQPAGSEIPLSSYVTQESLSEEDRRLTALMQGLSKYAVQDAERGKILNNLAVHFAESNRTELALDHFRSALGVLKSAGPERYKLAQQVLKNMSDACRTANYAEADEYDRMRSQVSP